MEDMTCLLQLAAVSDFGIIIGVYGSYNL